MKKIEDVLNIHSLKRQGLSQRQIARKLGIHRQTVKKYLEHPQLVQQGNQRSTRGSKLDPYLDQIQAWIEEDPEYSAVWIYDHLVPLGFKGSYEIVKRKVRSIKEQKQQIAYIRFETEPGYQAQVDFGEFQVDRPDGSVDKYYAFAMILGYSRKSYGEFIEHCDLPTFLDCHIRAFKYLGGVPREILYDRMRNVFIGKVAGKAKFNSTLQGFALHYGFAPVVAPAYAAWVKGKVERPYHFIREGFWRGYSFTNLVRANHDLLAWLDMKDERVHGTIHEKINTRFERERSFLQALPPQPFDTSYRIYRKVQKDCTVRFEGNWYVVPHTLVGTNLLLRVKDTQMRIFHDNHLIVTYTIPSGKGQLVQDPRFYAALRQDQEMNQRKYHAGKNHKGRAKLTISPVKPHYALDVATRPVYIYDQVAAGGNR